MRIGYTALFVVAISSGVAVAQPAGNPYSDIARRNAFGLKEPPPPVPFQQPPPARPGPKLVLTGVADFSTARWAFVTRTDPGRPQKNYTLSPGENEGGLQLIEMDAKTATVTLLVDGIDTVKLPLCAATNHTSKPTPASQFSGIRSQVSPRLR